MDGDADLDTVDRGALERAMQIAQRDPFRAQQLQSKLKDEAWVAVAEFAAYSCQIDALNLKPWESPPCHADEDNSDPQDKAAQHLLRRMLTRLRHCDRPADASDLRRKSGILDRRPLIPNLASRFHRQRRSVWHTMRGPKLGTVMRSRRIESTSAHLAGACCRVIITTRNAQTP
jgi:hypothetical protein